MKNEKKEAIIVPYPMNNNAQIYGYPSGSYFGIPVYPFEDPIEEENSW